MGVTQLSILLNRRPSSDQCDGGRRAGASPVANLRYVGETPLTRIVRMKLLERIVVRRLLGGFTSRRDIPARGGGSAINMNNVINRPS